MRLSRLEIDRMGMEEILRLQREAWREPVELENANGVVSMVIGWYTPPPPCSCPPDLQHAICLFCNGAIPRTSEAKNDGR